MAAFIRLSIKLEKAERSRA